MLNDIISAIFFQLFVKISVIKVKICQFTGKKSSKCVQILVIKVKMLVFGFSGKFFSVFR